MVIIVHLSLVITENLYVHPLLPYSIYVDNFGTVGTLHGENADVYPGNDVICDVLRYIRNRIHI